MFKKQSHVDPSTSSSTSPPKAAELHELSPAASSPFISIEEVASRLRADVAWVREKCRRRCPNPMPVFNLGRHLVFDWAQVVEWVRATGRGAPHMKHHRARKTKKAA